NAFMRLAHALDAVLRLAAIVGKLPDDFVIATGRCGPITGAAAESYRLSGSKLVCHIFSDSLRHAPRPSP
ncbi:MAG: hypothetical protein ACXWVK_05985, partial [Rhodoplanes sp.]